MQVPIIHREFFLVPKCSVKWHLDQIFSLFHVLDSCYCKVWALFNLRAADIKHCSYELIILSH